MRDKLDLDVGQGETLKLLVHIYSEISGSILENITSQSFSGQIRENYTSDEIAANFNITKIVPYDSGSIYIVLDSDKSSTLTQRKYVYDIKMSDQSSPPIVRRILEGALTVYPSVTR